MSGMRTETRHGQSGWVCQPPPGSDCTFWANDMDGVKAHWATGVHRPPDPLVPLRGELEGMLAAYKRQVEQELALAIVKLLELTADAKAEQGAVEGTVLREHWDLQSQAKALREFIPTVKVMAELPLDE